MSAEIFVEFKKIVPIGAGNNTITAGSARPACGSSPGLVQSTICDNNGNIQIGPEVKEVKRIMNKRQRIKIQRLAIARVYRNEGAEAYVKKDFSNAVYFATDHEGIKVNCKDEDLMAILYTNRAYANLFLGNYIYSLVDAKNATGIRPLLIEPLIAGAIASAELNLLDLAIDWCDKGLMIDEENTMLIDLALTCAEKRAKDNKDILLEAGSGLILGDWGFDDV